MKFTYLRSLIQRQQVFVGNSMLILGLTLLPCAANAVQLGHQARVTSLQVGAASEGSRVTVISDSPLDVYESFRRGNRFYIKIPHADLVSAIPRSRADGFDDMQVQKQVGGLLISFKLQPAATARVDQRGNRLDIIFAAPKVIAQNKSLESARKPLERELQKSDTVSSEVRQDSSEMIGNEWDYGRAKFHRRKDWRKRDNDAGDAIGSSQQAIPAPTISSNESAPSQPALASSTPISLAKPEPSLSPSTSVASTATKNPTNSLLRWAGVNRMATGLGAVVLLSLIFFPAFYFYRRR